MLLIALAALTWGTIGIAVDLLYRVAPATNALSIGFLRLAIAVPPLLLLSRLLAGRGFLRFARRDALALLTIGAAFAAYQVCYFAAISRIGVAVAVLINICSAPVFIALLASVLLQERLNRATLLALLGATGGTALLVGAAPQTGASGALLTGAALALGAGFAYALVAVAARSIAARYHPVQPIAAAFTLGALLLLPFALAQGLVLVYPLAGWLLLLHLGVLPTALGYALYLAGLRTTPATASAVLVLLEPLISALLALLLLQERLAPLGWLGASLLLGSMALLYLCGER
jgi:drug/metabolite transporter, DME family